MNTKTDMRRARRCLTVDEFGLLIAVTGEQGDLYGMSGAERVMLYLTAGYTGLRASELASLTPASFDFSEGRATVTVEAAYSKHRRRDVLPLHEDLSQRLQAWLAE